MTNIIHYLNPVTHLGRRRYSTLFPLSVMLATCILSEIFAYNIARNPMVVAVYAIFLFVALIIYFAFREGIKGGFIATSITIAYYLYIIYSRRYTGTMFVQGIETTAVLAVVYGVIAVIIGWLKQRIDWLIEREAEEKGRLEAIIEQLPVGIIIADTKGKVSQSNKRLETILGVKVPLGFQVGKQSLVQAGYLGKPARPSQAPLYQAIISGKSVGEKEFTLSKKGGKQTHVLASAAVIRGQTGNPIAYVSIINDITQQKKAEENNAYHAHLLETMSDAVVSTDMALNIISWNNAAERLYGYSKKEAIGKKIDELINTSYPDMDTDAIMAAITKKGAWTGEVIQQKKDGTSMYILSTTSLVKDTHGIPIGIVGVNKDITERKQVEQRKDDFISIASHELKTPVTSLKAFTQLLAKEARSMNDTRMLPFLDRMENQINRLTRLINDMLDVSRIQTGKLTLHKETVDFDTFIQETIAALQPLSNNHTIELTGKTNAHVALDQERIAQVLTNLINNGIVYSPDADKILVNIKKENGNVTVVVTDFGIGIPPEEQQKIFDRFYRAQGVHEKYQGQGIGLFIVAEIIKRHGGAIAVDSTPNKGATFTVSLPV